MQRFVPLTGSLTDNAPGYNIVSEDVAEAALGPLCWKCSGTGSVTKKVSLVECKVCSGRKRLPVKSDVQKAKTTPGMITRQTLPPGWEPKGPRCVYGSTPADELPSDLSLQDGEQMCVFVGNWRIIQRKGGHRWTTDDIVTGWVAGKLSRDSAPSASVQHTLDLGCGNGSVLLMVAWQYPEAQCFGMDARSEAVGLARRSIKYNVGDEPDGCCRVKVINQDFRTLIPKEDLLDDCIEGVSKLSMSKKDSHAVLPEEFGLPASSKFDLVTGTPPYFQVDFEVSKSSPRVKTTISSAKIGGSEDTNETNPATAAVSPSDGPTVGHAAAPGVTVEKAIIRQSGMPTCKESAPARCEFRGGIEAYCAAAAATLAPEGVFVVCENYANHDRALQAARDTSLRVISIQRVIGKEGKPPLFCVYTMVHAAAEDSAEGIASKDPSVHSTPTATSSSRHISEYHYEEDLVVRDKNGAWTLQYAQLLKDMSYPVASLHPNGTY